MRVGGAGWSIQVQRDWDVAESPGRLLLSGAEYGGDLELIDSLKLDGAVAPGDLEALGPVPERWQPPVPATCGAFSGWRYGGDDDGLFMMWWRLAAGPVLLRAFFNGLPRHSAAELAEVEAMLATLRLDRRID